MAEEEFMIPGYYEWKAQKEHEAVNTVSAQIPVAQDDYIANQLHGNSEDCQGSKWQNNTQATNTGISGRW